MKGLWKLERGAAVLPAEQGVRFTVWAPNAKRVRVRVTCGQGTGEQELGRGEGDDVYTTVVRAARAGDDYVFLLDDDDQPLPDPVSRWQPEGVHGPSRVVDPAAFRWHDGGWRGVAMRDLSIYELHIGTFTDDGTFTAAIPFLRSLRRELGVSAIEIMPVAQFPGTRNWGYDGVELYAVQNSYGGPEGLKQLVDAAHREELAVILDVVYNHLGPEGNYLPRYGPYFTDKYKTPWGAALNYDDAGSDDVRRYMVENSLYWVTEYHIDGLRLDAVHGIFDFSAKHLLEEIAEEVHAQAARLGRRVLVIAESDLNDPKLVRPITEHGYGLDGQWSDDFHHAVHAALTGERLGYYADFGGPEWIAAALREPFVYAGAYSRHRNRRHGGSSVGLPREKFVVAIQNHDQVGNRAVGDRLATALSPERHRLAAALLLLSPYVPLIFMGQEYGETNPFQYFVSHSEPGLVDAVRTGRRQEFASFGWVDDVPDPQSEETFRRSVLDRTKTDHPDHASIFAFYRDLLALRNEEPMLRPDAADLSVEYSDGCITILRAPRVGAAQPMRSLLAIFNCTAEPAEVTLPEGEWTPQWESAGGRPALGVGSREADVGSRQFRVPDRATDAQPDREFTRASPTVGVKILNSVTMPPWSAALYGLR